MSYTASSIVSESITWNKKNAKKNIKALFVNTKNANTFTGKQGLKSLDEIGENLANSLTQKKNTKEEEKENQSKLMRFCLRQLV